MSWLAGEEGLLKEKNSGSRKGGSPITNPTIAVVKVRFGNFLEALDHHNTLSNKTLEYSEKINSFEKKLMKLFFSYGMRWKKHITLPEDIRKEMCEEYGLVYFYRKNEIIENVRFRRSGAG